MPIYAYKCDSCDGEHEEIFSIGAAPDEITCVACAGGFRKRVTLNVFSHREAYQMKAIMSDGSRVKGHFGADKAKRIRGKK